MGPSSGLTGPAVEALLSPLTAAAARKLPNNVLISEDAAAAHRCAKAFAAVQVLLDLLVCV